VQARIFETKITLAIGVVCKGIEEAGRQRLKTKAAVFFLETLYLSSRLSDN
jgi:hypothetical protein